MKYKAVDKKAAEKYYKEFGKHQKSTKRRKRQVQDLR